MFNQLERFSALFGANALKIFKLATRTAKKSSQASLAMKNKQNLNVGTIGHVDHGKTTLTAAITRVLSAKGSTKYVKFDEIDKAKEEKRRGITINIAHIGYESDSRRYAHTDCPGHSDFIKNMICGASQIDVAILVIAATDGVMAQTREHLLLSKQLGVENIIVFINKIDLVDDDVVTLVEIEAHELLEEFGFKENSIFVVKGSALRALETDDKECIQNLISTLDSIPLPERSKSEPFIMPIASRVSITGRGTVVVGTVEQGRLEKGHKVEIKGGGVVLNATASDIQVFKKSVDEVNAGDHCGVLCRGVKADAIRRGMWLGALNAIKTSNLLKVELYLLSELEGGRRTAINSGFTEKVFCSTWDKAGRIYLENDLLMPGEHCTAYIAFMQEVPVFSSLPFTIREGGKKTIARGIIRQTLPSTDINSFKVLKDSGIEKFVKDSL